VVTARSLRDSRKSPLIASVSRTADSRKSIVAPLESMARHTPTRYPNVGLIDPRGLDSWLEMTPQPLFEFRVKARHPPPDCGLIRPQTALGQQFFNIAERKRVPQILVDRAQDHIRFRLPPIEDCRSHRLFDYRLRLPAASAQSCSTS
jgi:hypothetical protein